MLRLNKIQCTSTEGKGPRNEEKGKAWRSVQDMEVTVAASSSVPLLGETARMLFVQGGQAPQTRPDS